MDETPQGYSQIAAFQSSDPNFLQYRGFGYLHARLLSSLQFEVEVLERMLDGLDEYDKARGEKKKLKCKERDDVKSNYEKMSAAFKSEFKKTRPQVLLELKTKLMEYG